MICLMLHDQFKCSAKLPNLELMVTVVLCPYALIKKCYIVCYDNCAKGAIYTIYT